MGKKVLNSGKNTNKEEAGKEHFLMSTLAKDVLREMIIGGNFKTP